VNDDAQLHSAGWRAHNAPHHKPDFSLFEDLLTVTLAPQRNAGGTVGKIVDPQTSVLNVVSMAIGVVTLLVAIAN
jgi:hypothetical protein